jgi:hypothetical protein
LLPIMDSIDCLVHMEMVVGKELASLVTWSLVHYTSWEDIYRMKIAPKFYLDGLTWLKKEVRQLTRRCNQDIFGDEYNQCLSRFWLLIIQSKEGKKRLTCFVWWDHIMKNVMNDG